MKDQATVYEKVASHLPGRPRHVSGGLADARGVSDVDIALVATHHARLLPRMPEGTEITKKGDDYTIYSVPGYDRVVNVFVTNNGELATRSATHRKVEIDLEESFPELANLARFTKEMGWSTEEAWALVLDLPGDPHESMLEYFTVMKKAREVNQRDFVDDVFSVFA